MNKLAVVKKMVLSLSELDNTDNLEDERLSNTLLTYHVTVSEEFMSFEPATPQYKKLKIEEFNFLTPRIINQKDDIMTDGLEVTVVLHI